MAGTATLTVQVNYAAPISGSPTSFKVTVRREYTALLGGEIAIPTGFAGSFDVPFGLMDNADGFLIRNNTNQGIGVNLNDNGEIFTLAPGGEFGQANGDTQATIPLTEIALGTTETQQAGNNKIAFYTLQRA